MKPGSFTQIYIQLVIVVKNREAQLTPEIRPRIYEYLGGILTILGHKSIIINGVSDHLHLLLGLNPKVSISDTVFALKRNSSLFINENKLTKNHFQWQEGYGAFSCSRKEISNVTNYILNQEKHHQKQNFKSEYMEILKNNEISFDEKFLFHFF